MISFLKGEEPLVQAFWLLGIGYWLITQLLNAGSQFIALTPLLVNLLILFWIALFAIYNTSVWRCAKNTEWVGWTIAAKVLVCSRTLFFVVRLGAVLSGNQEAHNTIVALDIGADILVGVFALLVYGIQKHYGMLEAPVPESSSLFREKFSDAELAKRYYLERNYKSALHHFKKAKARNELDDLSKRYMEMCERRLNKST